MTVPSIKTDIAIVGAGPTGLMLANLLGLHGIKTTILERRDAPFTEPRAIAFDPETLRLFQTIGCYEYLAETAATRCSRPLFERQWENSGPHL